MADLAIAARGLKKLYGTLAAVDGIDLAIPAGTVYAMLGPNDAGKTTMINILAAVLPPMRPYGAVQPTSPLGSTLMPLRQTW